MGFELRNIANLPLAYIYFEQIALLVLNLLLQKPDDLLLLEKSWPVERLPSQLVFNERWRQSFRQVIL